MNDAINKWIYLTMNRLEFDDKLFQRGRTWDECLESWSYQRRDFLTRVSRATPLVATRDALHTLPNSTRLAVYFAMNHLDARLTIPLIGATLETLPQVEARFFGAEYFFPLFHTHFGRATPRLAMVDDKGEIAAVWGPRPDVLEQSFQDARLNDGAAADHWLLHLDTEAYDSQLDQSLHGFLQAQHG